MSKVVSLTTPFARYPLECRDNSSDLDSFTQVFIYWEYSPLDVLPEVSLVIDCGAYVGYSSAYFLSCYPGARVIAVEPDEANFEVLRRNLAPYGERVQLVRAGIWSHECRLRMVRTPYRDGREWSRQVRECGPHEPADVPGIDLGTLLARSGLPRISVLKMDVEGAEGVVFAAGRAGWLRRVDNIAIELHDDTVFGECSRLFYQAIAGENFNVFPWGELVICKRQVQRPEDAAQATCQ
jgi:FkbM family methyltransferase